MINPASHMIAALTPEDAWTIMRNLKAVQQVHNALPPVLAGSDIEAHIRATKELEERLLKAALDAQPKRIEHVHPAPGLTGSVSCRGAHS